MTITQFFGQVISYLFFIGIIGYFSTSPAYTFMQPDQALIKLAFNHAGKLKEPCRKFTPQELADKPQHLRKKFDCPRERSPVYIVLQLNGQLIYENTIEPSGLAKDLPSPLYERFEIPFGQYQLHIGMRDYIETEGFDFEHERQISLAPSQILVIDFDPSRNEFTFH